MTGIQELIDRSIPFLEVVKNRTAGAELELRLNGPTPVPRGSRAASGARSQTDQWPEPFRSRQQAFGESVDRDVLGIAADDATGRRGHHRRNYEFFGAPVALIVTVSRGVSGQRSSREPTTSFARFYDS